MIVDPQRLWQAPIATFGGGRAIEDFAGVVGKVFELEGRHWTVRQLFLPITRDRTVRSGVRAMVSDEWGIVGFVNQRDLELLLGVKRPKEWCHWLGTAYPEFDSRDFFGVCADPEDLKDELHMHEFELRIQYGGILPGGLEYTRLVHKDRGSDYQQLLQFLWDADPKSGVAPDPRLETIDSRWIRVQEERVVWR